MGEGLKNETTMQQHRIPDIASLEVNQDVPSPTSTKADVVSIAELLGDQDGQFTESTRYLQGSISASFLENRFCRTPIHNQPIDWLDFVEAYLTRHDVRNDKDGLMFNGWLMKPGAKVAEHAIAISLLCLDFDGESTIEQAKHVYSDFEYLGYTSWSHRHDDEDCFRLVFPLAQPAMKARYYDKKDALANFIAGADASCLAVARFFYLPACSSESKADARIWLNEGKRLNLYAFPDNEPFINEFVEREVSDADREQMIQALHNTFLGHEPDWWRVGVAMASNGFSEADFVFVTVNGLMREKSAHDAKSKWQSIQHYISRGHTISYGYLVNLVKQGGRR